MKRERLLPVLYGGLWLVILLSLAGCAPSVATGAEPADQPAPVVQPASGMPNPASVHCEQQGFILAMRTDANGGTYGVCIFPDGSECEEWAYFRGECAPAGASQPAVSTDTPSVEPAQPPQLSSQPVALPVGVIVNLGEGLGYSHYGRDGGLLGQWLTSSPLAGSSVGIHIGGPAAAASPSIPLILIGSQDNAPALQQSQDGILTNLASFPPPLQFGGMAGLPGQPLLAYTAFEPAEAGTVLRSKLFVGELSALSSARPALTLDSQESSYIQPVALHTGEAGVDGVWYTYTLWGIGGGPLLDLRSGLYYLELSTGNSLQVLGLESGFSGISPDQSWVAYSNRPAASGLILNNIPSGQMAAFARLPDSQAGPSFAAISHGNIYVAWQEAKGSLMEDDYLGTLRVATLAGGVVTDYPDSFFMEKIGPFDGGGLASIQVRPVGWLDDQILLVSIRLPQKGESQVLGLDVTTGEVVFTLAGYFAGLAYP